VWKELSYRSELLCQDTSEWYGHRECKLRLQFKLERWEKIYWKDKQYRSSDARTF